MRDKSPLVRPAGSGTTHDILGTTHVYKATPDETGNAFLLFELTVPPGFAAPPHRHHVDCELFYILEGTLTLLGPDGTREIRAGDTCFLPAESVHAFRNDGSVPTRALVVLAPGQEAERFYNAVDSAMRTGTATLDTVTALAARHQLTVLPPA